METTDPAFEKYVGIAIQTVLQRNRNTIHLLMNTEKYLPLIKDLSTEILATAKNYHYLTESAMRQMNEEQTFLLK